MKRGGQAWGFDLIIATGIFVFGIIVFFLYSVNYPKGEQEKVEDLTYEGNIIADNLISVGNPENWTINMVSKIGLLTNNKIDQSKLDNLNQLALLDYGRTRSLFNTKYNYFINASSPLQISGVNINGIGNNPVNAKNNIKISRITIYQNKPITLEVQVWE